MAPRKPRQSPFGQTRGPPRDNIDLGAALPCDNSKGGIESVTPAHESPGVIEIERDNDFRVDIIVVTHNSPRLGDTFSRLSEHQGFSLIVVDNASDSPPVVPSTVQLVTSAQNRGFGWACNVGASAGHGPYILFLNPDCDVSADTILEMSRIVDEYPAGAIISPRTLSPHSRVLPGGSTPSAIAFLAQYSRLAATILPSSGFNRYDQNTPSALMEVDWVGGGCMLLPRHLFETLGGFDDRFFMYGEDVDLCLRASDLGAKILLAGHLTGDHPFGEGSIASVDLRMAWLRNLRSIVLQRRGRGALHRMDIVLVARGLLISGLRLAGVKPSLGRPNFKMLMRHVYWHESSRQTLRNRNAKR